MTASANPDELRRRHGERRRRRPADHRRRGRRQSRDWPSFSNRAGSGRALSISPRSASRSRTIDENGVQVLGLRHLLLGAGDQRRRGPARQRLSQPHRRADRLDPARPRPTMPARRAPTPISAAASSTSPAPSSRWGPARLPAPSLAVEQLGDGRRLRGDGRRDGAAVAARSSSTAIRAPSRPIWSAR